MKYVYALILVIVLIHSGGTQSLERLDANNGYRIFKFGMSPGQFHSLTLKQTRTHVRGVVFYDYTGKDITEFNNVNIAGITLGFYNNRLYLIGVDFGTINTEYTKRQFGLVHENLEANFGSDITTNLLFFFGVL